MEAHSLVQYYFLKRSLVTQDADIRLNSKYRRALIEGTITFTTLKDKFFKRMESEGKLICVYCQEPLKIYQIEERARYSKDKYQVPKDMATIEHLVPVADGGLKYVESNWACACSKCNNKRDRLPVFKVTETKYIF